MLIFKDFVFISYLFFCSFTDIKYRKVYNCITFPAIFSGFLLNYLNGGKDSLLNSFYGFLFGFFFLLIFFILKGVGPGDVKFLAGAGTLSGIDITAYGTLYGAIVAGIYSLIFIIWKKRVKQTLKNLFTLFVFIFIHKKKPPPLYKPVKIPYVVFLAAGLFIKWLETKQP